MVQTEASECDEASKGFSVQVVQIVVAQTKPFDVLQALNTQVFCFSTGDISIYIFLASFDSLPGMPC